MHCECCPRSPQKLFDYDCVTLYIPVLAGWGVPGLNEATETKAKTPASCCFCNNKITKHINKTKNSMQTE